MLILVMAKNIRPKEEQQAFTLELARKLEDAVWGRDNQSGTIISEIDYWFKQEILNYWFKQLLVS